MSINIQLFNIDHQKALYNMSKGIMKELFSNIQGYKNLSDMENPIRVFTNTILENIPLTNLDKINGQTVINKDIIDIKDELYTVLQNLILADYFFNRDEDNIWSTGVSTIITCIRFNDNKNVTARLNGENRSKHIFNSKAFMDLRNSLEVVKNVRSLSIAYKKKIGNMKVKFEADVDNCLSILILSHRYYDESDFYKIWEMYSQYERKDFSPIAGVCSKQVG